MGGAAVTGYAKMTLSLAVLPAALLQGRGGVAPGVYCRTRAAAGTAAAVAGDAVRYSAPASLLL